MSFMAGGPPRMGVPVSNMMEVRPPPGMMAHPGMGGMPPLQQQQLRFPPGVNGQRFSAGPGSMLRPVAHNPQMAPGPPVRPPWMTGGGGGGGPPAAQPSYSPVQFNGPPLMTSGPLTPSGASEGADSLYSAPPPRALPPTMYHGADPARPPSAAGSHFSEIGPLLNGGGAGGGGGSAAGSPAGAGAGFGPPPPPNLVPGSYGDSYGGGGGGGGGAGLPLPAQHSSEALMMAAHMLQQPPPGMSPHQQQHHHMGDWG